MIRIMIADDEKIVIDALSFIIKNNFDDVQVVATARSGREAIEIVENFVPDLIFMDIRMPGINGIDAIREIKSRHKDIVFVILTAFEQFDFAKEAINLGVLEYLLKPVNKLKVVEVVNKAIDLIEEQRKRRHKELGMREKLENLIPILESGFINAITTLSENEEEILNYLNIFEIKDYGGYLMSLEYFENESQSSLQSKLRITSQSQNIHDFVKNQVQSTCRCIVGPVMVNRVVIFVQKQYEFDETSDVGASISLAETLFSKLSKKFSLYFKLGIGNIYDNFAGFSTSYEQSLQALRSLNGPGIMHFNHIKVTKVEKSTYPYGKEKILLQKLSLGDTEESIEAFHYIFQWLTKEYEGHPLKIKNKLLEIIFLVNSRLWEYDASSKNNEVIFLEHVLSIEDIVELKLWCKKTIENISSEINLYRHNKIGDIIKNAKEYIETNYYKAITLEEVSREVNVSSQYLSKLFKLEMRENFIDYLTTIRIEKAKTLLVDGKLTIKQICYKIGYSDPNYFSRIFKKIVGIPPTEYKK